MKHLIITADDYGVFPAINEAVIEAVKEDKINSVSVLANFDGHGDYPSSIKNLENLLNTTGDKSDIGCHLTVTSGKPITGEKMNFACNANGYYRTYTEFKNFNSSEQLTALKEELCEQVKRLETVSGFKVKHLTNHHNSLTLFPHHLDVYMEVARSLGIPMRSVNNRPERRQNFYLWFLDKKLMDDLNRLDRLEIEEFAERIGDYFQEKSGGVKTPKILDSRHYGPIPILPLLKIATRRIIKQKRRKLDDLLQSFKLDEQHQSLELLVHLAKRNSVFMDHSYDLDYPGVDRKYFDSRAIEFASILGYNLGQWKGIEKKRWQDL